MRTSRRDWANWNAIWRVCRITVSTICLWLTLSGLALAQTSFTAPVPPTLKIEWQHDGLNTTEYLVGVDGVRWTLGLPTPVTGTYSATVPAPTLAALTIGTHQLTLIAKGAGGEAVSMPLPITILPGAPSPPTGVTLTVTITVK